MTTRPVFDERVVWVSSIFAAAAFSAIEYRLQNRGGTCIGKSSAHNYLHRKNLFLKRSTESRRWFYCYKSIG
jgi:hypothetical protein